jgi:hypothetical protein
MGDVQGDLPSELRAFLHSCIDSIEQVEILMIIRGSDRFRTAREVGPELGMPVAAARRDLETLAARGLLEVRVSENEIGYRYGPKTPDLARYADLLAQHYITARPAVLGFVARESSQSIKRFADAFRLRDPES